MFTSGEDHHLRPDRRMWQVSMGREPNAELAAVAVPPEGSRQCWYRSVAKLNDRKNDPRHGAVSREPVTSYLIVHDCSVTVPSKPTVTTDSTKYPSTLDSMRNTLICIDSMTAVVSPSIIESSPEKSLA